MHDTVGHIVHERTSGETIRDTFGDYITDDSGKVTYFEPGVLAAFDAEIGRARPETLGGIFRSATAEFSIRSSQFPKGAKVEKTLVLIKPDNFKFPNLRPGGVIEVFSRTGLYIVGFKVHRMSVAQAKNFTDRSCRCWRINSAAKKAATPGKTSSNSWPAARPSDTLPEQARRARHARNASRWFTRAKTPCSKIREVLGPTDPSKAPPGSIRKEFGQTIMVNAAHASDSAENAQARDGDRAVGRE